MLILMTFSAQAEEIFPDLLGEDLLEALVDTYKPNNVLSYGDARDLLYGEIYNENNYLSGVYSGYTIYMDPYEDPSSWAYQNGINCEHTWPQSKGATGNGKSDMHHLYPTRVEVNSARGSDPFADSQDSDTERWYRDDYYLTYIPDAYIDEYSEDNDDEHIFEPREDHKGNAARACFYFYTMYKDQADEADPNFFDIQKEVLFQWHQVDPADEDEITSTNDIGEYQEDKPNPFVLDPTLVQRAYFPESFVIPETMATPKRASLKQNYPNPFNPTTTITFQLAEKQAVTLTIYDIHGKLVKTLVDEELGTGYHSLVWNGDDERGTLVESGIYIYRLMGNGVSEERVMTVLR
jgi:hypothetical protein